MVASMGYKRQDEEPDNRAGTGYRFDAAEMVKIGRRRELIRTGALMVALYVAQWPLRLTALGALQSATPLDPEVPARLSLLVDLGFLLAEMFVALRAWGWVLSRRLDHKWRRCSFVGVVLVFIGAALHFIGLVRLWFLLDVTSTQDVTFWLTPQQVIGHQGPAWHPSWPGWHLTSWPGWHGFPWYSLVVAAMSLIGLGLALYPLKFSGRPNAVLGVPEPDRSDEVVICCSGGGIRASAFSLGGLQVLQEKGIYGKASAVVGVSGGGYIAAAHHIVRWNIGDDGSGVGDWELKPDASEMPAYSSGSPETHWLRRHTKYLLDSMGAFTHAALSLAFGIAVNLLLVTVAIGGAAWLLGWLFLTSGRLHAWNPANPLEGIGGAWPTQWGSASVWTAASYVWVVPLFGVALFVLEKVVDRFHALGIAGRSWLRIPSRTLIWVGGAITLLVLVVPFAVQALNMYVATSGSPSAWLLHQFGLVPDDVCTKVLQNGQAACGATTLNENGVVNPVSPKATFTVGTASLAAVVSSILAVLASAKGAATTKDGTSGPWASLIGRV
jgi:hypothetical protein